MTIFITMIVVGLLIGFVGAGGSGFIISILTAFFGVPIHLALGTSLAAMIFTSFSGAVSHFRENSVILKVGLITGFFAAGGAFVGSRIANLIPGHNLAWLTAGILFFSGLLMWFRLFTRFGYKMMQPKSENKPMGWRFIVIAALIGLVNGLISGVFGIGGAMFIQLGLLIFLGLPLDKVVGTTMMIIVPIAFVGGFGYYTIGYLDPILFLKVTSGMMIGTYIGAKFTKRLPESVLKSAIVITPIIGALILILG